MAKKQRKSDNKGNLDRGDNYLDRIKDETEKGKTPWHPRHHGVKMQAHHLISEKALTLISLKLKKALDASRYNMNFVDNLVFLPSTFQGACHLQIQPHKSGHEWKDSDTKKKASYHRNVSKLLFTAERYADKECVGQNASNANDLVDEMKSVSLQIMDLVQNFHKKYRLSQVAQHFTPGNHVGCSGADLMGDHNDEFTCPVDRNHCSNHGSDQSDENISYVSNSPYVLMIGK